MCAAAAAAAAVACCPHSTFVYFPFIATTTMATTTPATITRWQSRSCEMKRLRVCDLTVCTVRIVWCSVCVLDKDKNRRRTEAAIGIFLSVSIIIVILKIGGNWTVFLSFRWNIFIFFFFLNFVARLRIFWWVTTMYVCCGSDFYAVFRFVFLIRKYLSNVLLISPVLIQFNCTSFHKS